MADEGAGCLGAVIVAAVFVWVPLHFSGKSILYWRETKPVKLLYDMNSNLVTCSYFNSTGTEETFATSGAPNSYYCPRIKDVGK